MNIVVLTKLAPDTEARLSISGDRVNLAGVDLVVSPFDEYGLEEAIRIKEANEGTTVHVLMVGPEAGRKQIVNCLALGADEAIIVDDAATAGSDPHSLAKVLVAEIKKLEPTIVFAGKQGVDYDWGLTAIAVAAQLGWPHVGVAKEFKADFGAKTFTAVSESDEGDMTFTGALPAVVTAEKGLNTPRYASLKGIMGAKKKPFNVRKLADTGVDAGQVGAAASTVEEVKASHPPERPAGRIIAGDDLAVVVAELVKALREEARVI
jgi:electron transfer flavoprotein beta subunit